MFGIILGVLLVVLLLVQAARTLKIKAADDNIRRAL